MQTYGQPQVGQQPYDWLVRSNPGGAPFVGNQSFRLTVSPPASAPLGLLGLGFAPIDQPLLGFRLFVSPTPTPQILAWLIPPGTTPMSVGLPIPNSSLLGGLDLFAQVVHTSQTGLVGSAGLKLSVF